MAPHVTHPKDAGVRYRKRSQAKALQQLDGARDAVQKQVLVRRQVIVIVSALSFSYFCTAQQRQSMQWARQA
jgi:hypothetical protein